MYGVLLFCLAASYSHRGKPPTTIGAEELNFRVRDGNGCGLFAIAARLYKVERTLFFQNWIICLGSNRQYLAILLCVVQLRLLDTRVK